MERTQVRNCSGTGLRKGNTLDGDHSADDASQKWESLSDLRWEFLRMLAIDRVPVCY